MPQALISVLLDFRIVRDKKARFLHALLMSTWLIESCLGSAFLKGAGTHRLQKEWRHGKSLGSLLLKLNLQIGHVSISSNVLCCFVLSSSAGKLSASFSTIITKSSTSLLAFKSILWSGTWNPFQSIDTTLRMDTGNPVCFSTYMENKDPQLLKNRHLCISVCHCFWWGS